jgi:ubiquinol-cytochrome c reductase iron-sulfur subunit
VNRILGWLIALRVLLRLPHALRESAPGEAPERDESLVDPRERRLVATPRREALVLGLFAGCVLCAVGFIVVFFLEASTQWQGLTIGGAFVFLAAALSVAGNGLVPQVTEVEPRPQLEHPELHGELVDEVRHGGDGISRRKLLVAGGLGAGATVGAALAVPAVSLGPAVHDSPSQTPWRDGRRLVDEQDEPIAVDGVEQGSFLTAFPEGADKRELGSPVVVVRVDPRTLRLPADRRDWAPEGILAFSKICTHAGCAVTLYRSPLYEPTAEREPALQCPCHYSTFAVRRAAEVTLGPAPRPLPQLPLRVDADGLLLAAGPLSGPVGPSWWGVRRQ